MDIIFYDAVIVNLASLWLVLFRSTNTITPQFVQKDEIFVNGTPGLDYGRILQYHFQKLGTLVAVLRMIRMLLRIPMGGRQAGGIDQVNDETGIEGRQLHDRRVGKGMAIHTRMNRGGRYPRHGQTFDIEP